MTDEQRAQRIAALQEELQELKETRDFINKRMNTVRNNLQHYGVYIRKSQGNSSGFNKPLNSLTADEKRAYNRMIQQKVRANKKAMANDGCKSTDGQN